MTSLITEILNIDAEFERYIDPNKLTLAKLTKKELKLAKTFVRQYRRIQNDFPLLQFPVQVKLARRAAWAVLYPQIFSRHVRDTLAKEAYAEFYRS